MRGRGVPHVHGRGRHVEVATDDERAGVRGSGVERVRLLDPAREPVEPGELAEVERRVHDPAIGGVDTRHAKPVHGRRDHPGLIEGVEVVLARAGAARSARPRVPHRPVAEIRDDVRDRETVPRRDRDAVPAALAVVDELIAGHREGHDRRVLVRKLGLLDEEDVRFGAGQPVLDRVLAGFQRVDVPCGDAHQ